MKREAKERKIYDRGIFLILIFIVLLFFIYNNNLMLKRENILIRNYYSNLQKIDAIYFEEYIKTMETQLIRISKSVDLDKIETENHKKELVTYWNEFAVNNKIKRVVLLYDDIKILASDNWSTPEGFDIRSSAWYKNNEKSEDIIWSEPYTDKKTKEICITISKKIKNSKGETKALLSLDTSLANLMNIFNFFNEGDEIFVYNVNSTILAHNKGVFQKKDLKDDELIKKIENTKEFYFYNDKGDAYVFYKNNFDWTIVSKITKMELEKINNFDETSYFYFIILMLVGMIHILYRLKNKGKNDLIVSMLKSIQNREDLKDIVPNELKNSRNSLVNELYNVQTIIENLEKEILKDEETGLYNEIYLENYGKPRAKKGQKILIIKYLNMTELKNNYGKNVVELVLKRGAMTLNAMKESDEYALRIDKNTLALVLNNGDFNKRAHYIVDEILNYKWKLYNININIIPELISFEEYKKNNV